MTVTYDFFFIQCPTFCLNTKYWSGSLLPLHIQTSTHTHTVFYISGHEICCKSSFKGYIHCSRYEIKFMSWEQIFHNLTDDELNNETACNMRQCSLSVECGQFYLCLFRMLTYSTMSSYTLLQKTVQPTKPVILFSCFASCQCPCHYLQHKTVSAGYFGCTGNLVSPGGHI